MNKLCVCVCGEDARVEVEMPENGINMKGKQKVFPKFRKEEKPKSI